ncbi:hypothetical protein GGH15_001534 [Coemansia sp. RSA 562]|nr:hypothetical protein GGH15_001534 [Coemansia sp. RSA 562]
MPRALFPEIFWQIAQYNIVDAVVIAAVLFFGIGGRLKLQSYYGQPLTILTSAVLVALAAACKFTNWLQYLPVLAAAGLPVLAAHPDGYVVFQVANMLGIYQATSNQPPIIGVAQVLSHTIAMLSTLDQPKINYISSMWSTFSFAAERKLLSKDNITLEDIPQRPEWLITATSNEIILDSNQPYFIIQAIVRAVWKPLTPLCCLMYVL